jgi:AcrR family transcriptional regulator
MMTTKQTLGNAAGDETRNLLINAGTGVFLRDGFRAARVSDIAAEAGVRLSAINYHFGGKDGLYLAVLQHHAMLALAHVPVPRFAPGESLQQRFAQFVRAMVYRMLDPASPSRLPPLMIREAVNPTSALDVMFERFMQPLQMVLAGLLREVFGPDASEALLARAALSVLGQGMIYVVARPLVSKLHPDFYEQEAGVEALAEHIVAFSWAGVQAIAEAERNKHE